MATQQYSEDYIDQVFYHWYENGKQTGAGLTARLQKDLNGRTPTDSTVNNWVVQYGWVERADKLDVEVSKVLDTEVIDRRVEMYKRHAEIGQDMVEMGIAFLKENGIKTDQAAIRAIDSGVEIQRVSVGLAEAWQKISTMSDDQLTKELARLSGGKTKPEAEGEFDVTVPAEDVE